jgi:outer membrane protein assembly factor BamB
LTEEAKASLPIRRWPAILIAALAGIAIILIWILPDFSAQQRILNSVISLIITLALLLLWALLFSRLRWKIRVLILSIALVKVSLLISLVQIRGVSGDLLPILGWSWTAKPGEDLGPAASMIADPSSREEPAKILAFGPGYPQFLGPDRNATVRGIKLEQDWEAHPPALLWRRPIGAGWSGFAVLGEYAITQEQRGDEEMVVCYDLFSGKILWAHSDVAGYESSVTGNGPRATPTINAGRVYTFGGTGILNCLDLTTGHRIWSKNTLTDNNAENVTWGASCSPLLVDSLVVVSAGAPNGRSLVAYHMDTGEFIWGGGSDPAAYSSPLIATLAGTRQIITFNDASISAHNPQDGKLLWRQPWPSEGENVVQPVPLPGDRVLVSAGYGIGTKLFQIEKKEEGSFSVNLVWESRGLKAKFANVVHKDGFIYGLDNGILVCLDLSDGKRKWKRGRYGHGQVVLVDDLLLVMSEKGEVALVEPNPESHIELGRFKAFSSKTWNSPALAGKYLLVRNNKEAACYVLGVGE